VQGDETIGPWTVRAPDAAGAIVDLGGSWGWLNIVDAAVDVDTAFSGESILDDGYANATAGQEIEVLFFTPVVNVVGPDLVMFDARFDEGEYAISSDFDGFTATTALGVGDFIDTGEDRDYFYELNDDGPFFADIWGAEIDLSDIGVPLGSSVTVLHFISTNGATDPIGMGAIVPAPGTIALLALGGIAGIRRRR